MRSRIPATAATRAGLIFTNVASAQTTLRLGKAQANQFAFIPADVGVETGIFKKHGIALDISAFAGDAKMVQALTAGSLDIALGGSPSFSAIVKGAPMKAVAVFSGGALVHVDSLAVGGAHVTADIARGLSARRVAAKRPISADKRKAKWRQLFPAPIAMR